VHITVCAPPGGGSNFLASLFTDSYLYTPQNNEYRVYNKPHWNNNSSTVATVFDGKRWVHKTIAPDSSVSRMHSCTIPNQEIGSVAERIDVVYNILTNDRSSEFVRLLDFIKNRVIHYTVGNPKYIELLPANIDLAHFASYCRWYGENVKLGLPICSLAVNYFVDQPNPSENDFKEYVRSAYKQMPKHQPTVPRELIPLTQAIQYDDLFFDGCITGTPFDDHLLKIESYHQRNVALVIDFCNYFEIPVDLSVVLRDNSRKLSKGNIL